MDAKTLAKSKRAHSLHHSKKSHNQKPKPQQPTASDDARTSNNSKKVKEKPSRPMLPSNWDRYEEELDSDAEQSISKVSDGVVLPKSKGADFRHLIAEAQSQCRSHNNLDAFLSPEDVFSGFNDGIGPMLSVRGEGILSWTGDDNFVVEDEAAGSHEVSFLSLNLHALAEQLTKVDISERLFIEADLLPSEQGSKKNYNGLESDKIETSETKSVTTVSEELILKGFSEDSKAVNQNQSAEISPSMSDSLDNSDIFSFNQGSYASNQVNTDASSNHYIKFSQRDALESSTPVNLSFDADSEKRQPTFEAASAEAELDMLLDSFSETKFLGSSGFTSGSLPVSQEEASKHPPQLVQRALGSSKPSSAAANLDDLLDNLLEETSNSRNLPESSEVKARSHEVPFSTAQSESKCKDLDDFDSWLDTI